jgi:putative transport protein
MAWFVATFRHYPELTIFLALALGYWVGGVKLGKISLGSVTGTLLMGILIGQMHIEISPVVKSTFFLMFLFALGYSVGPQFFRGLKSDGVPQAIFAILQCLASLFTGYVVARLLGYDVGSAAGLLGGSQTISAVIGVSADAINQLAIPDDQKKLFIDRIAVAYALTYLFGTAGAAWFIASLGPKILRVDLAAECKELDAKMGATGSTTEGRVISASHRFGIRAYRVTNEKMANKTVGEIEALGKDNWVYIIRVRHGDEVIEPDTSTVIHTGDTIAVITRQEVLVEHGAAIGPEVEDKALLDFPAEALDAVVTNKAVAGKTLAELAESETARGVFLRKLVRAGSEMPFTPGTRIDRGDVMTLVGAKRDVERVATYLGYADRQTSATDMVFVGTGIVLGGLVGALAIKVGGMSLGLSTSGGALIAGLVFGWLRSVHRTFGRVPEPALWIFNSVGLNAFIAVVGISSGPGFVGGLKELGVVVLIAGAVATVVPLVIGMLLGKYVFKFHPAVTLGAVAGARTASAAIGALEDVAQSKAPLLGYTVTYAVGNTLMTIWGLLIVMMMQ